MNGVLQLGEITLDDLGEDSRPHLTYKHFTFHHVQLYKTVAIVGVTLYQLASVGSITGQI